MTHEVRLPNGLCVELRGSKVRDQARFEDALRGGSLSRAITAILTACTERVVDPGPWARAVVDGRLDWTRAASGDRLAAMMALRALSWPEGHLLRTDMVCPQCPEGRGQFEATVDLRSEEDGGELYHYPIPEDAADLVARGEPFAVEVAGHTVRFGPALGTHEERLEALSEDDRQRYGTEVHAWAVRISDVSDVHANDRMRWLADLDLSDGEALDEAMDAVDGGVDLGFEVVCPRRHRIESVVPFDLEFWRPHRARRERRRHRRPSAE